ncbi:S-adenosylmethionine synthetase [Corynebacterium striatum]|uniref:S-adenosylmethionine synthetase n=1 Tax=Corynebacterium striatum TaxID=43770 RepID=UPI0027B8F537|nr:S-adenosylmethionine synthetase [Corynebacterium striatum]
MRSFQLITSALVIFGLAGAVGGCDNVQTAPEGDAQGQALQSVEALAGVLKDRSAEEDSLRLAGELDRVIRRVEKRYGVEAGVAIDAQSGSVQRGLKGEEPTWSTIKVPIAIAAAEVGADEQMIDLAIEQSDNDAAYALWTQVQWETGDANGAVSDLLDEYDAPAKVEDSFGYSTWTLKNQAAFGASLPCVAHARHVNDAMDNLIVYHDNGLSALPDTRAKGGWGLSEIDGMYTHRQFGVRSTKGAEPQSVGLAIEVVMPGDDFSNAESALNALAKGVDKLVEQAIEDGAIKPYAACRRI